jgi:hypothetical protein
MSGAPGPAEPYRQIVIAGQAVTLIGLDLSKVKTKEFTLELHETWHATCLSIANRRLLWGD